MPMGNFRASILGASCRRKELRARQSLVTSTWYVTSEVNTVLCRWFGLAMDPGRAAALVVDSCITFALLSLFFLADGHQPGLAHHWIQAGRDGAYTNTASSSAAVLIALDGLPRHSCQRSQTTLESIQRAYTQQQQDVSCLPIRPS